jgi:hypothetical protein
VASTTGCPRMRAFGNGEFTSSPFASSCRSEISPWGHRYKNAPLLLRLLVQHEIVAPLLPLLVRHEMVIGAFSPLLQPPLPFFLLLPYRLR